MATLNLIIGPMFSGKTTELLRISKRLQSINLKVLLLNYFEDTRYFINKMSTHYKYGLPCTFLKNLNDAKYENFNIICINETQFFKGLLLFCKKLLKKNTIHLWIRW